MPVSARAIAYAASIKEVKLAVAGFAEMVFEKSKVEKRYVFDKDHNRWAGLLRSEKDMVGDVKQVNAVCCFYNGLDLADPEFNSILNSIRPIIPIGIAYFRQYRLGTDASNVEDVMMDEIARFQMTLAENKDLGLSKIAGHAGIRIPKLQQDFLGDTPVIIGGSLLRVFSDPRQTVGVV